MLTEVQDLRKAVAQSPSTCEDQHARSNREAGPLTPHRSADLLRLDGVGVRLGGRQVLSDVTFSLGKGEFAGIIGPNGAGKTTLLRVILGLLEPSGGRVLIDGEPLHLKPAPQEQGQHRLRAAEAGHRPRHAAARPRRGVARP